MTMSDYFCILCKNSVNETKKCCDIEYTVQDSYFKYSFDKLLFDKFAHKYLLNKSLNNNGFLSYLWLAEGSLALPNRPGVSKFRDYIEKQTPNGGVLLDIGCGTLEMPGYLNFSSLQKYEIYGIDPIDKQKFVGHRIVGCIEFTPFPKNKFDSLIYCTSLDHVCSLEDTLKESKRILKDNGKVILWVGCNAIPFRAKVRNWLGSIKKRIFYGYDPRRFRIYPDWTVLYIPKGCFDPFHSYRESPKHTIKQFKKAGFSLFDYTKGDNRDENFLTFIKN